MLNYILRPDSKSKTPISLDLFEAERYEAAVVVQQLVGNLIYYSNHGKYEPRLPESFEQISATEWIFTLRPGFRCNDGEEITAAGFKRSIELTILGLSHLNSVPIFKELVGYDSFLAGHASLSGIRTDGDRISFEFNSPMRDGLLQTLAFAPYGYICAANRKPDGTWINQNKFVSSGPYRVKANLPNNGFELEQREDWPLKAARSPKVVQVIQDFSILVSALGPTIIDTRARLENILSSYKSLKLVPEYLAPIILGGIEEMNFFSRVENRIRLRAAVEKSRTASPDYWKTFSQSQYFYPSKRYPISNDVVGCDMDKPIAPLVIEGEEPIPDTINFVKWQILESALKCLNWDYTFAVNVSTFATKSDPSVDIRIPNPAIGVALEAWGISSFFCSFLGGNLPDPSGRIRRLVEIFETGEITEQEFTTQFGASVSEDSAVLPLGHYGLQFYLSPEIRESSLSPLLSIVRFEDLEIK